ncbi:MAG TPA: hypothetical protein VI455_07950 [Terriglobia bacterium]
MSLVKSPSLSPKKIAANRANAVQSHGPSTPEGRERMRQSKTLHGASCRESGEALRILGEDPEQFARLLESVKASWQPSDEFQAQLAERLARALWQLGRTDRAQQSIAVGQVQEADRKLRGMVRKACQRYEQDLDNLDRLAEALAAGEDFVAGEDEFDLFNAIFGEEPEGRGRDILVLLNNLMQPPEPGQKAPWDESDPLQLPDVPVATGPDRTEARDKLAALLQEEIEAVNAARDRQRENTLEENGYFRDSALVPSWPQASDALRMEESSVRQIARLSNLLLKLKGKNSMVEEKKTKNTSHDVSENK